MTDDSAERAFEEAIKEAERMAEESREGLKDVLGDIKFHTKTRHRSYGTRTGTEDEILRREAERRARYAEELARKPDWFPTPPRPPVMEQVEICDGWDNNYQGGNPVTTLKETAVLSMDPQKAAVVLRCSYNPEFIESMKQKIPSSQRRWDPTEKLWIFHPDALQTLKQILAVYYGGTRVVGVQRQIPATKFDQLLARLTPKDKQAIYVLLVKRYHPDVGGSVETMTLINEVFKT